VRETQSYPGEVTSELVRLVWSKNDYDAALAAAALHEPVRLVDRGDLTGEYVGRHRAPDSRTTRFLFSRSRFRRAQVYDFLAVALLLAVVATLGMAVVMLSTAGHTPDRHPAPAAVVIV